MNICACARVRECACVRACVRGGGGEVYTTDLVMKM